MKVLTGGEMRNLDRRTIQERSVPVEALMENAGRCVAEEAERTWGPLSEKGIAVAAGKGNNGGDGLVAARHLWGTAARVEVFLSTPADALQGEAGMNLRRFQKLGGPVHEISDIPVEELTETLSRFHVIVDALLGTGISSPVTGGTARLIEAVNRSGRPVLSVDLPSGIHADTGKVMGTAVRATVTVTLGLPKRGLLVFPGAEKAGRLCVADIGFPPDLIGEIPSALNWVTPAEVSRMLSHRAAESHKGVFGHVLVVAGSRGKGGAGVLAAHAALRVGAGLATLALPAGLEPDLPSRPAEVMTLPLPATAEGSIGRGATEILLKAAQGMKAVALGPGLSTHPDTVRLVRDLIPELTVPMVIDADALNGLAGQTDILKKLRAPAVLTPHPGEMARLIASTPEAVQADRLASASEWVGRYPVTLVLKGARTIVAYPNGTINVNSTGNPGMASAGTGDALTGMIAGLIAQGYDPQGAALLGVYLHGLAGDMAAAELGPIGLMASDLLARIPAAIRRSLPE